MKIRFNPRDNGACPFCKRVASCGVRESLAGSVASLSGSRDQDMEIVIYSCPQFVEKF
jgi:hypothetical protein